MKTMLIAISAALVAGGCAGVPNALRPAADESPAFTLAAKGVQIYECRAGKNAYEWAFVAPGAELYDARGRSAGLHGAGPIWQAADGSRVVAAVKQRADAPVTGAIPWLLLGARSIGSDGVLSKVTSIQRVNTTGGVAPATGCTREAAGTLAHIPYTADYHFFTSTRKD